jgi:hypothetical protein
MNVRDYEEAARSIVATLGPEGARELLQLLEAEYVVRADLFRQMHERGTDEALLDAMTDLEADSVMRGCLVEYLR